LAFRVFVSAVSKELGEARLEVARVLRRKGLEVKLAALYTEAGLAPPSPSEPTP